VRTIPSGLLTHTQSRRLFLATLWQVEFPYTTKAGVSRLGFTNHNTAVSINLSGGSLSFSPKYVVKESSFNTKLNTAIDDTELYLKIDDDAVNWFDIRTKAWHGAVIRVGKCNWKDISLGSYILAVYTVSNVMTEAGVLKLELRGLERQMELHRTPRLTLNCQHTFAGTRCGYNLDPPAWAANTQYALSTPRDWKAKTIVKPTVQNGFWYEATVAGTSHATTEPTWPTTAGDTVVDNAVTWTAIYAGRLTGIVTGTAGKIAFEATGLDTCPPDWFSKGRVLWLTGDNETMRMKVYSDDGAGVFVMEDETYNDIVIGDSFLVDAGCRKRIKEDCSDKYNNTYNAWAYPFLVNENAIAKAPTG